MSTNASRSVSITGRISTAVARLGDGDRSGRVVIDRDHGEHRSEDLLLGDAVHRLDRGEDRRAEEVAVGELAISGHVAPDDELPLAAADTDVRGNLLDRGLV